ncbi:MAG: hypothetical protein A2514_16020 [Gammaproteobacteria bacterium RIFOXYD12_FULL_61_37]|nr:MAG: hypothetical protein A2514_16020 [Gammaproteobacteria bacterium RIFOXYD12_FULL_61_37]
MQVDDPSQISLNISLNVGQKPLDSSPAQNLTMSSVEIADLAGKRHDNVMRDTRKMLAELHGEGGGLNFEDTHTNPQNGQSYPIFRLPKRETLVLVSGYSVSLRAKIVDRWQELEAQIVAPVFDPDNLSRKDLLQLAIDAEERRITLQKRVDDLRLTAGLFDRLEAAEGAFTLQSAAKILQQGPSKFTARLQEKGWIGHRSISGPLHPAQDKIDEGFFHTRETLSKFDPAMRWTGKILLTPKGLANLGLLLKREAA